MQDAGCEKNFRQLAKNPPKKTAKTTLGREKKTHIKRMKSNGNANFPHFYPVETLLCKKSGTTPTGFANERLVSCR